MVHPTGMNESPSPQSANSIATPVSTLTTLVAENTELSAKLRTQLQKNIELEAKIQQQEEEWSDFLQKQMHLEQQNLIWREKERAWIEKWDQQQAKIDNIEQLEKAHQEALHTIKRYQRYQERIKQQVKPYLEQSKAYSRKLQKEYERLIQELNKKNGQIKDLHQALELIKKEVHLAQVQFQKLQNENETHLKLEKEKYRQELYELQLQNRELQQKASLVDQAYFRQNELENQIVSLKSEHQSQIERAHQEHKVLRQKLARIEPDWLQLKTELPQVEQRYQASQLENQNLHHQLETLRMQWHQQSQALEKHQLMIQSLKDLNQDLGQQLSARDLSPAKR